MGKASLKGKLYLAFSVIVVLVILTCGVSIWRMSSFSNTFVELLNKHLKIADISMESSISLLTARRHEKDFIARKDNKYVERMKVTLKEIDDLANEMKVVCDQLQLTNIASTAPKVIKAKDDYKKAFGHVAALIKERGNKTEGIAGELRGNAHGMEKIIKALSADKLMIYYLTLRRHEKDLLLREDLKYVEKANEVIESVKSHIKEKYSDSESQAINRAFNDYLITFKELADNIASVKKDYPVMSSAAHEIEELLENVEKDIMEIVDKKQTDVIDQKITTINFLYGISVIITIIGVSLSYFSVRSIVVPIQGIISGMSASSDQVSSASEQVASSGQSLASGSSEQASSLEEISSSLEEMSSMTKQNADNANQADGLSKEALAGAEKGAEAMTRMSEAIDKIKSSSDETAKIIKTIDEIAFQTNLLALNAAVEAARAGEAGKGFAVVAEEVRNLAQRSAEAAKDTSALIEGSQVNANNGVAVSKEVEEILQQIVEASGKVTDLVAEVTSASNEQAQGIEQINSGVGQLDQVTQSNAANAEESASAGEELSAQAVELSDMVGSLVTLIEGDSGVKTVQQRQVPAHVSASVKKAAHATNVKQIAKTEKMIPLDDDDFSDF